MSTSRSASVADPVGSPQSPDTYQSPPGDCSSLDFLSLIGLDGSTPLPGILSPQDVGRPAQPEAGPFSGSAIWESASSEDIGLSGHLQDRFNGQGDAESLSRRERGGGFRSSPRETMMEVDQQEAEQGTTQADMDALLRMGIYGQGGEGGGFNAGQAVQLQEQLEQIHMRSPLVFDPSNGLPLYHPAAPTYPTSPTNQRLQRQQDQQGSRPRQQGISGPDNAEMRKGNGQTGMGGVLTPALSGDMFPQTRYEQMSPMQLEMLARGGGLGGTSEFNAIPLLSPAMSHQANGSTYTSPANQTAFSLQTDQYGQYRPQTLSPLEQLQEQQKHFQQQLVLLQHQQRQIQATAAAVAASTSPYIPSSGPGSGYMRPVAAPGGSGRHSAGGLSTPSPGYFSPLTSPALDSSSRTTHRGQNQGYSPARPQSQRQAHPLSALSSPALNPVGSSGGAQQTISPALNPQNDMADPDYIRALVGLLEEQSAQGDIRALSSYQCPVIPPVHQAPVSSPLAGPSSGTGPHRSSLTAKSRPSPMMKPTIHRSHGRQPSSGVAGQLTVPSSPLTHKYHPSVAGMSHLPPAAMGQRGVHQHQQGVQAGTSSSSTPSPVDLSQIMPPPPLPQYSGAAQKGITPMTPASLMNLGQHSGYLETQPHLPVPSRQTVIKKATTVAPSALNAQKAGNGTKTASNGAGKRALGMRHPGSTSLRPGAATFVLPEGHTRRTSHKAAEQKRRDSLKAGFDELRLLLPPINTEALDPESGEPIPGSSAPRLLPKSSLVPDDNPNRGVSKVALLKFSNEYIEKLHEKVVKRDGYIEKLRSEVSRLRVGNDEDEVVGDEGEDLLEMDMLDGEGDDLGDVSDDGEGKGGADGEGEDLERGEEQDMEDEDEDESVEEVVFRRRTSRGGLAKGGVGKSPALGPKGHSGGMMSTSKAAA